MIRIRIHITVAWRDLIQPFKTLIVPHLTYILETLGIRNQICLERDIQNYLLKLSRFCTWISQNHGHSEKNHSKSQEYYILKQLRTLLVQLKKAHK